MKRHERCRISGDPEAKVRQRYLDLIVNPSARDQLRARSNAIRAVRETLLSHDYIEVETPILQTIHGGANARPFHTPRSWGRNDLNLFSNFKWVRSE